jgi:hypothetical protein
MQLQRRRLVKHVLHNILKLYLLIHAFADKKLVNHFVNKNSYYISLFSALFCFMYHIFLWLGPQKVEMAWASLDLWETLTLPFQYNMHVICTVNTGNCTIEICKVLRDELSTMQITHYEGWDICEHSYNSDVTQLFYWKCCITQISLQLSFYLNERNFINKKQACV